MTTPPFWAAVLHLVVRWRWGNVRGKPNIFVKILWRATSGFEVEVGGAVRCVFGELFGALHRRDAETQRGAVVMGKKLAASPFHPPPFHPPVSSVTLDFERLGFPGQRAGFR